MVLWVDKYRPSSFDKMEVHTDLSDMLKSLASSGDFPHLMLYGPSGAGKKTRVVAFLRQIYGSKVEKVKLENKEIKVGANESKTIVISTLSSSSHIEISPSDSGIYDRYVVSSVIKEIAQTAPLDQSSDKQFKVVVLNEVDQLTKEAQQALRRTMEKYMKTCRLILCANSTSKVIPAIKSRCLCIRIPAPTDEEITTVLEKVAKSENITLPKFFSKKILDACDGNLRRALLMLQASKTQKYPFQENQEVKLADWEKYLADIARDILEEQSPKRILEVRDKFYVLLTNCIPADLIFKRLASLLFEKIDSSLQHEVAHWVAIYEHRMKTGSRPIFHIEAFVAKFMSLYKKFLMEFV